ncbi:hypothetical protein GYMLUDRAFT_62247 [Collybiopsis luxurians FD-317 M1]|uniref:Uncharacterized protein n=1 Tax=Collybiopsis luxurians FD-317 M1 TaxID=944289 RepID=A0A0D0BM77_9AGAR|nr:hypothetical protein GYMLUDRAFT_62247 [Collybiopsis luxurians FD-317 M1]
MRAGSWYTDHASFLWKTLQNALAVEKGQNESQGNIELQLSAYADYVWYIKKEDFKGTAIEKMRPREFSAPTKVATTQFHSVTPMSQFQVGGIEWISPSIVALSNSPPRRYRNEYDRPVPQAQRNPDQIRNTTDARSNEVVLVELELRENDAPDVVLQHCTELIQREKKQPVEKYKEWKDSREGNVKPGEEIVQNREEIVQQLQEKVQHLLEIVQKWHGIVQQREESVQQREENVQKQEERVQQREKSVQQREESVQRREEGVHHREESVQEREESVQRKEEGVRHREESVQEREEILQQREKTMVPTPRRQPAAEMLEMRAFLEQHYSRNSEQAYGVAVNRSAVSLHTAAETLRSGLNFAELHSGGHTFNHASMMFNYGYRPPFWLPSFGPPSFGAPSFGAPSFGAPSFGTLSSGPPSFGSSSSNGIIRRQRGLRRQAEM